MSDLENDGKNWTWEETLIAFDLYSRIPYSKISEKNAEVIRTAILLKRKPGAVSKKLFNIAANDPNQTKKGNSGLQHCSKLDQEIWDRFESNPFEISVDSKKALSKLSGVSVDEMIKNDDAQIAEVFPYGEEKAVATNARIGQYFFREAVLSAYDRKCCVTGITEPKLLIASHIKPWRDSDIKTERTNPRNGLCLNALHDKAFDQGLITLSTEYKLVLSTRIKDCEMDEKTRDWFMSYSGKTISLPKKFMPSIEFIQYHNDVIFMQ